MDSKAGNGGKTPQWKVEIRIQTPIHKVWDAIEDISLIPRYHPEVREVEYLSNTTRRARGVSYRCVIPDGQIGWCVERVVEHIPLQKTTIAIPEDSWGLGQIFDQFLTELTVEDMDSTTTLVRIQAFYVPKTWRARVMNTLRLRPAMRRRALQTLEGLRRLLEIPE